MVADIKQNLFDCVSSGDIEKLRLVKESNLDLDITSFLTDKGETLLHKVAEYNQSGTIVFLHKWSPALISMFDFDHQTPMHIAAKKGNEQAVTTLYKLDPKVLCLKKNFWSKSLRSLNKQLMNKLFDPLTSNEEGQIKSWIEAEKKYLNENPALERSNEVCSITQDNIYDILEIVSVYGASYKFERWAFLKWMLVNPIIPLIRELILPSEIRQIFSEVMDKHLVKRNSYWLTNIKQFIKYPFSIGVIYWFLFRYEDFLSYFTLDAKNSVKDTVITVFITSFLFTAIFITHLVLLILEQ